MRVSLLCALAVLLSAQASASPTAPALPLEALPGQESLAPADRTGRLRTQVFVNGQGPFDFIIDTAANRSAVSPALAEALALPPRGEGQVHALSGMFVAPLAGVEALSVGGLELRGMELPIISRDVLADADGLLGAEAMAGRLLTMDFENERIVIAEARRPLTRRGWSRVEARVRFGALMLIEARIGRQRVNVIIDTGAENSIANLALRDALVSRGARRSFPAQGLRALNAGPPLALEHILYVPDIELGGVRIEQLALGVSDAYVFEVWGLNDTPTIVLGMDVLRRARAIAIDYARGSVHFLL